MLLVTVGTLALGADGAFGRLDGAALLAGLALLTASQVRAARRAQRETAPSRGAPPGAAAARLADAALIVGGLAALVVGARALVDAASAIALSLGVGEVTIGLTIVAVGTSLPELATSVVAALRGERDLAIGNVVGSNVFNLLGILGLTSLLAPAALPVAPQVLGFDAWIALFAAALLLPLARSGGTLVRWEGAVLVGCYVAYLAVLVALASGRIAQPPSWIVIGLAGAALAVAVVATLRAPHRGHR
jgi:cation:H+ antiporter